MSESFNSRRRVVMFLAAVVSCLPCTAAVEQNQRPFRLWVEAESFANGKKWCACSIKKKEKDNFGNSFLYGNADSGKLGGEIKLPEKGLYHVWVRVWNEPDNRRGRITVNNQPSHVLGGEKEMRGWQWVKLGDFECDKLDLIFEGCDAGNKHVWYDIFYISNIDVLPQRYSIQQGDAAWIHFGSKLTSSYYRKKFNINEPVEKVTLNLRSFGHSVAYINGEKAAEVSDWQNGSAVDITRYVKTGENVIAIENTPQSGLDGIMATVTVCGKFGTVHKFVTDLDFLASSAGGKGWNIVDFDDSGWRFAKEINPAEMRKPLMSCKELLDKLNLDYPGLEKVKACSERGDIDGAMSELLSYYKNRKMPKHFCDRLDKKNIVNVIKSRWPEWVNEQVEKADGMMTHVFTYEGETRDVGKNVNWFQDTPGPNQSYAQSLSRFIFTPLCYAYWMTGKDKYAEEYIELIRDWIIDNPRPIITYNKNLYSSRPLFSPSLIGWTSLDTGERVSKWAMAQNYLINSPSWNADFNSQFLRSLFEQTDWLFAVQMRRGNHFGGNWQIVECGGLLSAAIMFPEFKMAKKWRDNAINILWDRLQHEVYADGGHIELNFGYHAWVLSKMLDTILLAKNNNIVLPAGFSDKVETMLDYYVKTRMPDGNWPFRGDGSLSRGGGSHKLLIGAAIFGRPDFKYFADKPDADLALYVGLDNFTKVLKLNQKKPDYTSVALSGSKHVIMRTGWNQDDKYMFFDCAPWFVSHCHNDRLNIDVAANGEQLIVDSGMPFYDYDICEKYFKLTKAHNVIMVDGQEHPRVNPEISRFATSADFDFAKGILRNYAGVTFTRTILFLKPDYWVLVDNISEQEPGATPKKRNIQQLFHFGPTTLSFADDKLSLNTNYSTGNILLLPADKVGRTQPSRLRRRQLSNILLLPADKVGLSASELQGFVAYERPYFPKAPYVSYNRDSVLPITMPIVLYPYKGRITPPHVTSETVEVKEGQNVLPQSEAICVVVTVSSNADKCRDYILFNNKSNRQPVDFGGLSSDASACCIRYDKFGRLSSAYFYDGTFIADKQGVIVKSDTPIKKYCDMKYLGGTINVSTDENVGLEVRNSGLNKIIINGQDVDVSVNKPAIRIEFDTIKKKYTTN